MISIFVVKTINYLIPYSALPNECINQIYFDHICEKFCYKFEISLPNTAKNKARLHKI